MAREGDLERLRGTREVDVLVLGGGVNGAGTLLDLALQGVDTLLVDRGDFCAGASAASSHMIHGGLRYLENGELRLVREALRERNRLLRNAPHEVRPLPTTIPVFKWVSGTLNAPLRFLGLRHRPAERGALVVKLGLVLYDAFSRRSNGLPRHRFASRRASLERFPHLHPDVLFTATYSDASVRTPERLCLELILDAEQAGPHARAVSYLELEGRDGDRVLLRDVLGGERFAVRPRLVVNATGAWIDRTNARLGVSTRWIGGTKGSHIVVDEPELLAELGGHEIFFENRDGRMVLLFPWMDRVLVGTTDIPIDDPDEAVCTEEEVDYFVGMVDRVFPGLAIARDRIVYRYSGVRPLPAMKAAAPGLISRDHRLRLVEAGPETAPFPVYGLVGGKWTTYRAFAEQAADAVLSRLGAGRRVGTADRAIGGGRDYPPDEPSRRLWLDETARASGVAPERLARFLDRYGTRAAALAAALGGGPARPLASLADYESGEVRWIARSEKVVRLDDLLERRTPLAMRGVLDRRRIDELAEETGAALDWSPARRREEADRAAERLASRHGVRLDARAR